MNRVHTTHSVARCALFYTEECYGKVRSDKTKAIASMPLGHCLGALELIQYIYNFLIGLPLPRRKCLGAFALSKRKFRGSTGLQNET